MNYNKRFYIILLGLAFPLLQLSAQDSTIALEESENLLIQFNKNNSIEYGKFGQDSIRLVLQVKENNEIFPTIFFLKGKILGDSSGFILNIPKELKRHRGSWSFSEYIATASTDNSYIQAKEYATFDYSPFNYEFITVPPNAEMYLVPLSDWKIIFNTEEINFPFDSLKLLQISKHKILQSTPCNYSVFEQPYIGVFVSKNKIKLEYIKPKRNTPKNNKAEITFPN